MLVGIEQIVEIVAHPQPDPDPPRRLVALQQKRRQQARWAMLDGNRVRQAEIVCRNDVRVNEGHGRNPQKCRIYLPVTAVRLTECYQRYAAGLRASSGRSK